MGALLAGAAVGGVVNIVRGPRRHGFVIVPNKALEDARLSFRARGVLAYLLSRPDGWQTDSERLALGASEGRDAIRTALTELDRAGYLTRTKRQDAGGHWITECSVTDDPPCWKTDAWKSVPGVTSGNGASSQVGPETGKPTVGEPGPVVPNTENKRKTGAADLGHCQAHDHRRPACPDCLKAPLGLDKIKPARTETAQQAAAHARAAIKAS